MVKFGRTLIRLLLEMDDYNRLCMRGVYEVGSGNNSDKIENYEFDDIDDHGEFQAGYDRFGEDFRLKLLTRYLG